MMFISTDQERFVRLDMQHHSEYKLMLYSVAPLLHKAACCTQYLIYVWYFFFSKRCVFDVFKPTKFFNSYV